MLKRLLEHLSPAGERGRLSVLILHRVLPVPDPMCPDELDAAAFERLCGWLQQLFNVIALDEAVHRLAARTLPARALAITFDDGYADNYEVALPILVRHGFRATFFITTSVLDGGCMWNDLVEEALRRTSLSSLDLRSLGEPHLLRYATGTVEQRRTAFHSITQALKYRGVEQRHELAHLVARHAGVLPSPRLMLSSEQVRGLHRAGMQIGSHTLSHPILTGLPASQVRDEVLGSKRVLETLVGDTVELFAYPNGRWGVDFDAQAVEIVREAGFKAGVTTDWGSAGADTDPYFIPRFMPWDRTRLRFGLRMAANLRRAPRSRGTAERPHDQRPSAHVRAGTEPTPPATLGK
ncbi:polysaccharide deacetylase family protein [uncultured Azohydromonas sp.]|uniref:polysaccharide deacetylase family protein n=1 Tax=uncultured Azohydromonas sp. TaxID=487342 RepID=UPI002609812C|nr:polysaccharide deacetylase family protein [uncultured Azohydromonas sp.]